MQRKRKRLSIDLKIAHGKAPDAGFASSGEASSGGSEEGEHQKRQLRASGRAQAKILLSMAETLGTLLGKDETLAILAIRLKRLISFETVAIYSCDGEQLKPECVQGAESELFSSLRIPVGTGVSGWVASNCKPIINGNPAVETSYLEDSTKLSSSQSALAVPLLSAGRLLGVVSLYRAAAEAFNSDDLSLVVDLSKDIAIIVENALKCFDSTLRDETLKDRDTETQSSFSYLTVN